MAKSVKGGFKLESLMIERLLSCPDLLAICMSITEPKYFVPELQSTIEFIKDYYDKYNSIPDIKTVNAVADMELEVPEYVQVDQREFLLTEYCEFCKHEAVIDAILSSSDQIEKGDYDGILEQIENAMMISIDRDIGTNPGEDVQSRLEKRNAESPPIPFKLKALDDMMGGGGRRTNLIMFSGGSGGGKSVLMTNAGLSFMEQGFHVLYISLELQEDLVSERTEKMVTGWDHEEAFDRLHETVHQVESYFGESGGSFIIKYMEAGSNANDFKSYLKKYEAKFERVPDVLIVDYLDLMNPIHMTAALSTNVFERDKLAAQELRSIGNNPYYNMLMITASQHNRGAVGETDLNHSHIAGGLSKINTVDYYFAIIRTDSMISEGIVELTCLKARSSSAVGDSGRFHWDDSHIRITNMVGTPTPIETPSGTTVNNNIEDGQSEENFDDFDKLFASTK